MGGISYLNLVFFLVIRLLLAEIFLLSFHKSLITESYYYILPLTEVLQVEFPKIVIFFFF